MLAHPDSSIVIMHGQHAVRVHLPRQQIEAIHLTPEADTYHRQHTTPIIPP